MLYMECDAQSIYYMPKHAQTSERIPDVFTFNWQNMTHQTHKNCIPVHGWFRLLIRCHSSTAWLQQETNSFPYFHTSVKPFQILHTQPQNQLRSAIMKGIMLFWHESAQFSRISVEADLNNHGVRPTGQSDRPNQHQMSNHVEETQWIINEPCLGPN